MKKAGRLISSASAAILIICCLVLILFGWSATGWKALAIPTSSMTPAIPKGSLVFVHHVPISSLKTGDVITYINPLMPKTTLSHRIIKKYLLVHNVTGFVTKGDANKIADVPITGGSVSGKVIWHIPNIGNWLLDIKKPIIILPIVYLAAIFIMAEEVIRLRDYFKNNLPYRLNPLPKKDKFITKRLSMALSLVVAIIISALAFSPSAYAFLKSNTVALINNRLTVSSSISTGNNCSNKNTVNVSNNNNQSASTGNAISSGENNSGSTKSGNATNTNSTSITINVSNSNC